MVKATIIVATDDSAATWEYVSNEDGSFMGPLEGDDDMTTEEVWEQIGKILRGEISSPARSEA